jgi:hypothetical protein
MKRETTSPPESSRGVQESLPPGTSRRGNGGGRVSEPAPHRGPARELGVLSAVGVLAAVIITVCTNVLTARFYQRWDVTQAGLYTLSAPTLETLHGLSDGVDIIVFLGRGDPDYPGLERLIDQYRAESRLLHVRYVDPDRDAAEFIALSNRYRLNEGRAEQGQLVSDAALVVARGEARWVVGAEDITALDEERGVIQPRAEQAITEGLRQVLEPSSVEVCFTAGHGEPSLDDGGPTGLAPLAHMLRRNNYGVRELNLSSAASAAALEPCALVVVAAPRDPFALGAAQPLLTAARQGKSLLVSVGPILGEDNRPIESGLEPLFELFDLRARPGLLFERDPDAVLPVGLGGEAFLARPVPHAITQGLVQGDEVRYPVLLQLAQALEHQPPPATADRAAAPPGSAKVSRLLVTSDRAFGVLNAAPLAEGAVELDSLKHDSEGPFDVAFAAELEPTSKGHTGGRLVLVGSSSPLLGTTWLDNTLAGTQRFIESSVSWLASRPMLVSLPEKPGRQVELRFTEESLAEVVRYVLMYMPGTALAIGGLILFRRRSTSAARQPAPARTAKESGREGAPK